MDTKVLEEIHFNDFLDWFIQIMPIEPLWKNQPTYLIAQASFLIGGLLTLVHALRGGGRLRYLWLATILHGLVVESICYILPDVDNFWHSQSPIMFLGRRLPLHIVFLYPCFIYQASIAAAQLKLPRWAEPFAVGLLVVLIDIPYDITSVKFVHWSWHDTDPNIADRHYWVPWNSYYFHLTFAASFTFWFHTVRLWADDKTAKWHSSRVGVEVLSIVVAAVLGPVGGVALFVPLYHPLHDLYHIHSEVTFFVLFSVALLLAWTGERTSRSKESVIKLHWRWLPLLALTVHYTVYLALVVYGHPEREVSVGLHEPLGPCHISSPVHTPFGVLEKNKFLCASDYDEGYFDFHCTRERPNTTAKWYTICGTPFDNRIEYITVISTITVLAFGVFWNIYFNLSKDTKETKSIATKKQKSQ